MAVHSMSEHSVGACGGTAGNGPGSAAIGDSGRAGEPTQLPHWPSLVRAVEGEIVPRLLLARRQAAAVPAPPGGAHIQSGDAEQLARLLLTRPTEAAFAFVESVRLRGVGERDLCLGLLAPAARELGATWDRDECDFFQVAVGLGLLHQLLHRISLLTPGPERLDSRGHGRRALLSTVPGDKHCFGLMMVSEFFRQNGWEVFNEFPASERELCARVRGESFALVGLSAGSATRLDELSAAVRAVRRSSRNGAVGIMVGGAVFDRYPELAARVGADATAGDGEQAARVAESVCALLAGEK